MSDLTANSAAIAVGVAFALAWAWLIYRRRLQGFLFGVFAICLVVVLRGGMWLSHGLWGQSGTVAFVIAFFACGIAFVQWRARRRKREPKGYPNDV